MNKTRFTATEGTAKVDELAKQFKKMDAIDALTVLSMLTADVLLNSVTELHGTDDIEHLTGKVGENFEILGQHVNTILIAKLKKLAINN